MHRTILAIGTLAVCCAASLAAAPSRAGHTPPRHAASHDPCATLPSKWQREQCADYHHSAPGDEYFGRMKLSYLGIDNTAHDIAIEAGAYTTTPDLIVRLQFASEALDQWEHRYPGDPQLARSYFLMIRALRKVYTRQDQQLAWAYMQHVIHTYPSSYFAKVLRADVARGFTEHWFANPEICPTPLPTENPRQPRPTPSPMPTALPTPVETPTPTPPGEPKINVMTPPCVQPQPTATPLPEESASPLPEPTSTPT